MAASICRLRPGWRPMPWIWSGRGIALLNPVFDLDFGRRPWPPPCWALGSSWEYQSRAACPPCCPGPRRCGGIPRQWRSRGGELLASLRPDDKVLVLITRNYGLSDPVLNMGIPRLLLERGHKVITLSHLPAHDLDLSEDYPNLYWPFGQHILVRGQARGPPSKPVCRLPDQSRAAARTPCSPICFGRRWGTSPICRSKWTSISLPWA